MLLLNGQCILYSHKERSHWMILRKWLKVYLPKKDAYIKRHFEFLFQVAVSLRKCKLLGGFFVIFYYWYFGWVFCIFKKYIKLGRRYIYPQRVLENESDSWFVWVSITLFFPGHLKSLSVEIVLKYLRKIVCLI